MIGRALALALLLGAGCASSPGTPAACVPGEVRACACVGGAAGAQRCASTGAQLEACVCPDAGVIALDAPPVAAPDAPRAEDAPALDVVDAPADLDALTFTDAPADTSTPGDVASLDAPAPLDVVDASRACEWREGARCSPDAPCVDLRSDDANCGGCGLACGPSMFCRTSGSGPGVCYPRSCAPEGSARVCYCALGREGFRICAGGTFRGCQCPDAG